MIKSIALCLFRLLSCFSFFGILSVQGSERGTMEAWLLKNNDAPRQDRFAYTPPRAAKVKSRGRPRKTEVEEGDVRHEDSEVGTSLAERVEEERHLQEEAAGRKKKTRTNNSKLWRRLLDEHSLLVADMVKSFSAVGYTVTKKLFSDRVKAALKESVFPPHATLEQWVAKATNGAPMKAIQGGRRSLLSLDHQADLLETIFAIRGVGLPVHAETVARHAVALMRLHKIQFSKQPSKSWCKSILLFSFLYFRFVSFFGLSQAEWVCQTRFYKGGSEAEAF